MSDWEGVPPDHFEDGSAVIAYQIPINVNTDVTVFYLP